jgi:hypothetical protein
VLTIEEDAALATEEEDAALASEEEDAALATQKKDVALATEEDVALAIEKDAVDCFCCDVESKRAAKDLTTSLVHVEIAEIPAVILKAACTVVILEAIFLACLFFIYRQYNSNASSVSSSSSS